MQKVFEMVFEILLQKGIKKINSFETFLILRFDFHLQNGSICGKTVCAIRIFNKISSELFQIRLSYLCTLKHLQLYKTTFLANSFFK